MRAPRYPLVRYALREAWRRPARTVLTLLGIAIGVAALVSIRLTADTARNSTADLFRSLAGEATLEITAAGEVPFDGQAAAATATRAHPAVTAVAPLVAAPALLIQGAARVPVFIAGVDPTLDGAARRVQLARGSPLADVDGALLEKSFAAGLGVDVGAQCTILTPGGMVSLPVAGIVEPSGPALFNGGALLFVRLATAQKLLGLAPGSVHALQLVMDDSADRAAVAAAVRAALPAGLGVREPALRAALAADSLRSVEQGLAAVSVMSLVAGGFIILNTALMSVSERRRTLALLRAVGATRGQITRLLLLESILLAVTGTVLGIVLGIGAAHVSVAGMQVFLGTPLPALRYSVESFLLAAAIGPGVALAATWFPASRAARRPVLEGLFPAHAERGDSIPQWLGPTGLAMLVATIPLAYGFSRGAVGDDFIAPAMAFALVACMLALPLGIKPLFATTRRFLAPLLRTEARIAFRLCERYPLRTSLTAGVLALAVIVSFGLGNSIRANILDFGRWFERVLVADYFVRAAMPDQVTMTAPKLPIALREELAQLPGVARIEPINFLQVRTGGVPAILVAREFASDGSAPPLQVERGDARNVVDALLGGEAAIGVALAQRMGIDLGGEFDLDTPAGPRRVRVAAIVNEYTVGGVALYMDRRAAAHLFSLTNADAFVAHAAPGQRAELGVALAAFCGERRLMLQTQSDLRALVDQMSQGAVGLLWALLGLVFVVAGLGVANTLTMSVIEQTRELGILRAIAMTRRQAGKLILCQALIIAVVSIPPGALAGVALAYALNYTTEAFTGHAVAFRIEPMLLVASLMLPVAAAVLAALPPARRATRLKVFEALSYE